MSKEEKIRRLSQKAVGFFLFPEPAAQVGRNAGKNSTVEADSGSLEHHRAQKALLHDGLLQIIGVSVVGQDQVAQVPQFFPLGQAAKAAGTAGRKEGGQIKIGRKFDFPIVEVKIPALKA